MTALTLDNKPFKGVNTYYTSYGNMTRNGHFGKFIWITYLNDIGLNTRDWDCPYAFK
jgi:hypothetical protein